jgi:hypothetical protein
MLPASQEPRISWFLIGGHVLLPLLEGQALLPAPQKPVSSEKQASKRRGSGREQCTIPLEDQIISTHITYYIQLTAIKIHYIEIQT